MNDLIEHLIDGWRDHLASTVYISDAEKARIEALGYRGRDGRVKHWRRDKVKD